MNKYQEYLEEAKKRYRNMSIDEMLDFYQIERTHLKLLKDNLIKCNGLEIKDEQNEKELIYIYCDDDNLEKILNLLIESCKKDLCMIKAIIFEQLESGKLFDEIEGED